MYRIILADDHVLVRQGIRRILEDIKDIQVVQEVGDSNHLLEVLKAQAADLVILDISMPEISGIEAAKEIKKTYSHLKVLFLTMHKKREYLNDALSAGADGYLLKEDAAKELDSAIALIRQGGIYVSPLLTGELADLYVRSRREVTPASSLEPLSPREIEILTLIAEGKSSKEIAQMLFLSFRTVQNHRTRIMKKLNLKKSADLVKYAIRKGYYTTPQ